MVNSRVQAEIGVVTGKVWSAVEDRCDIRSRVQVEEGVV